jgi:hypothetical protein
LSEGVKTEGAAIVCIYVCIGAYLRSLMRCCILIPYRQGHEFHENCAP